MNKHCYMPISSADDWKQFLAEPEKQWRSGYSAKTLAHSWMDATAFPPEVAAALRESADRELHDLEMLMAIPEHQVSLPGGVRPSQNDLWVLARGRRGLVSLTIEGKVSEPFDKPVSEWLGDASPGKRTRLAFLCETLGVPADEVLDLRYQLLHRTVSAILEARRFRCNSAVMLVHSFSRDLTWFEDFAAFTQLFGIDAEPGVAATADADREDNLILSLGWVCGDTKFLHR